MASRKNFQSRVEKRQAEAKVRQETSDKLSLEQKLAKATPGSKVYNKYLARTQK